MSDSDAPRQPIRVLIADDHAPTRQDIRMALERDARFEVVTDVPDAFCDRVGR
jgi:PleD family two-component response regulator